MVSKVLDRYRLDGVRRLETEDAGVEVKLGVDRAPDVRCAPEPVLLPFEGDVGVRQLLGLACGDELLGLAGRHDPIVEPLEKDDRAAQMIGEVDRRALAIEVGALRVWPDQRFEIARFELVRLVPERFEVADAEMRRACAEEVLLRQCKQRSESSGRSASDGYVLGV